MARAPRDHSAGTFHVTAHSVWSTGLFRDTVDYMAFAALVARTAARFRWECLEVVLMPNHYHLLLDVEANALPDGMRELNCGYARGFNRRYRLRGHVFAARYDAPRVETEAYLLECFRYVARNPVRAGLCVSPLDWPWSSYAGSVGVGEPFLDFVDAGRVIGLFGQPPEAALQRLRTFVEGHVPETESRVPHAGAWPRAWHPG